MLSSPHSNAGWRISSILVSLCVILLVGCEGEEENKLSAPKAPPEEDATTGTVDSNLPESPPPDEGKLDYRKWSDRSGKKTVIAALIIVKDDIAYLRREKGGFIEIPVTELSLEDQQMARSASTDIFPSKPLSLPLAVGSGHLEEKSSPQNTSTFDPRDALVLAVQKTPEKEILIPGILVQMKSGPKVIVSRSRIDHSAEEKEFEVALFLGTPKLRRIPAKYQPPSPTSRKRARFRVTELTVEAEDLPAIKTFSATAPKVGDSYISYFASASETVESSKVEARRVEFLTISRSQTQLLRIPPPSYQLGFVVDGNSSVIGFTGTELNNSSFRYETTEHPLIMGREMLQALEEASIQD